jgi:hypothetical protein
MAVAAVLLGTSVSPASGQNAASFLDQLDGAIEKERQYCDTLELFDDQESARNTHNFARNRFTTTAAQDERKAAQEFETARRTLADIRKRTHSLLGDDTRKLAAVNAKFERRIYEIEASRQVDRATADEVDAQLISIEVDISVMEAENQRLGSSFFSTPPKVRANNERIAQLSAERTTLQQRKRDAESRLIFTYQVERQYDAERRRDMNEIYASSKERFDGLMDATEKAQRVLEEKRRIHAAAAETALTERLTLETMDQCLTRRLAQIEAEKRPEKPTPKGEDLPPWVAAAAPKDQAPPTTTPSPPAAPAPTSTAGVTPGDGFAQVVGKLWPANARVGCRNTNEPGPQTGILNFRFTPPNKVTFEGPHKTAKPQPIEKLVVELDSNGRFSKRQTDGFTSEMIDGQIEFLTGADGAMRPVGSGNMQFTMDLSPLAGMIGGAFVPGAGHAVKLTPEEREKFIVRCDGTWQLPAG